MSTYSDYLTLRRGPTPIPSPHDEEVRIWADYDGVLHSLQPDGNDWKAGTGLPGSSIDVLGPPWEPSNPSAVLTPDGVAFGPYADGAAAGGSLRYHGLDGQPFSTVTSLAYNMRYWDDEGKLLHPGASPYARIFMQDSVGNLHDAAFTPGSQAYEGLGPGPFQEFVATAGMWRYDDDSGTGGVPLSELQAQYGDQLITKITITLGFTAGTNLVGLLRWWQLNATRFTFIGDAAVASATPLASVEAASTAPLPE